MNIISDWVIVQVKNTVKGYDMKRKVRGFTVSDLFPGSKCNRFKEALNEKGVELEPPPAVLFRNVLNVQPLKQPKGLEYVLKHLYKHNADIGFR